MDLLLQGEAAFTNLETSSHREDPPPSVPSARSGLAAEPQWFKEVKRLGVNRLAAADNHSLDDGIEGLAAHRRRLERPYRDHPR